ncbi:hypothetical protein O181_059938 [Austropuccinia psidii MF-1]|uniref:Uncharacterized protein n=1 Tax=Austropuccinia psidii MF-1 TaxID=1389203 RepID=A0A9Q3HX09_9BASI|nr:hypothetical protein [Austropuccinia psidii MF-1]
MPESSIEIQTSSAPRALITKEPFKGPEEVGQLIHPIVVSVPGHSINKSKRKEYPEAAITDITVVKPEPFPTGKERDIPVSVQELVYGRKATRVGTSEKSFHRNNELLSSNEEAQGLRKDRGSSEGFDTHVFQRASTTDKSLVEKPKYFVRGPEGEVGPRKGQEPSGSSSSLHKQFASISSKQGQESSKEK